MWSFSVIFALANDEKKVYIVYLGGLPNGEYKPLESHHNILQQVLENSSPEDSLIYSYQKSFNGFSAKLTRKESEKLASIEDIVSVFPSKTYNLTTTRSWDFTGLTEKVTRVPTVESDIIVGLLDTGIWPESESFRDEGFGPPPKKWKGECKGGQNFTCNNKLIGARAYGIGTARDGEGHGSHTASTVAGNQVNNVSFNGVAHGNARGAVPSARIAIYKVCLPSGCSADAILAAFDDAIRDGVDFLSVSLGGSAEDYMDETIGIGAFHAIQNGILTIQSAGNEGPDPESVVSIAPWILTVGASTTDRKLISKVVLGDKTTLVGNAANTFDTTEFLPLAFTESSFKSNSKDSQPSKGRINIYTYYEDGFTALRDNATGMIIPNDGDDVAETFPLPASALSDSDFKEVQSYMNNSKKPIAKILKSESVNDYNAPVVASFSSRGPCIIRKEILKPDIVAPGVDIIAAWSPKAPPTDVDDDTRSVNYNIISGTSMSCPHVSGVAAYVKSFHPNWSPAAIKSALMTTAYPLNVTSNPGAEFDYGAGHIDPVKAINPGLVYDASVTDYINMLCGIYTEDKVRKITRQKNTTCPKVPMLLKDLNYPTIISFNKTATFKRTVTNVGLKNSTYKAIVSAPDTVKIIVDPNVLSFESLNEKKSFVVTVLATKKDLSESASLIWFDGIHNVRSPIKVSV